MNTQVYEIAPGRYALGFRYEYAFAVVTRRPGRGQPIYTGVRGRRPTINGAMKWIRQPSAKLRGALQRVAGFN